MNASSRMRRLTTNVCFCAAKWLTLQTLQKITETVSVCVCVCVCLSVASNISETCEAIAITFDTVTVSVMMMNHGSFLWTLSEVIQQYARIR